jgi:hypothetical protein
MLGIGDVWYFRGKEGLFLPNQHCIMKIDKQHLLVLMDTN